MDKYRLAAPTREADMVLCWQGQILLYRQIVTARKNTCQRDTDGNKLYRRAVSCNVRQHFYMNFKEKYYS
jgi:hypothetical protein